MSGTGSRDLDDVELVALDAPTCPTCRAVWPELEACPDDGDALVPRPFLRPRQWPPIPRSST